MLGPFGEVFLALFVRVLQQKIGIRCSKLLRMNQKENIHNNAEFCRNKATSVRMMAEQRVPKECCECESITARPTCVGR